MWYFYDGVFTTLDSISHLNLNKKQMAHFSLLKIHANWMAEIPNEQESDSLIEICLNYYKNSNDYYMKALDINLQTDDCRENAKRFFEILPAKRKDIKILLK